MATETHATAQPSCTLAEYCAAKKLTLEKVVSYGVKDDKYRRQNRLRISYFDENRNEIAVRYRISMAGPDKFIWQPKSKTTLYGQQHLPDIRKSGYVLLVEGESDWHTAMEHGKSVLALPGGGIWKADWNSLFEGIDTIFAFLEKDDGGEAMLRNLEKTPFRERIKLIFCNEWKDISELHCIDPAQFNERLQGVLDKAVSWKDYELAKARARGKEAWEHCKDLANNPNILHELTTTFESMGVVGVSNIAKIIFLALTSRLLDRPVSVAVKAVSSAGKSFVVESALKFFPTDTYHELSAMSERALAYSEVPLSHRFLVIFEAAGMQGEMASYLIRSLLSEGRVRYETVEKTRDGLRARVIEREGPTGLLVTSTQVRLHPENETRLISLSVPDTPEQTAKILDALANEDERPAIDLTPWHALQNWLAVMPSTVTIPYGKTLAVLMPKLAVRLRRDFRVVLTFIRTHTLLHQANRDRDDKGRIIATYEDYAAIRKLISPFIAEGLEAAVPQDVRDTVKALEDLKGENAARAVTYSILGKQLKLDKSSGYRRALKAMSLGYIQNESEKGKPADLIIGEEMPADKPVLPSVAELQAGCEVAPVEGGVETSTDSGAIKLPRFSDDPAHPPCEHSQWIATDTENLFKCGVCESVWLNRQVSEVRKSLGSGYDTDSVARQNEN